VRITDGEVTAFSRALTFVVAGTAAPEANVTNPVDPTLAVAKLLDVHVTLEVRSAVDPFE